MKLSYLVKGFPGHPLHPPLTDATIGIYTASVIFAILCVAGVAPEEMTKGWWLTLIFGLIVSAVTALTGLVDWLTITWRSARCGGRPHAHARDGERDDLLRARRHLR